VDAITAFIADLFSNTGLSVNAAFVLGTAVLLALIIVSVVLSLGRRIDRLEECLMDLRPLHAAMQETQTDHAQVVNALESIRTLLPDLDTFKQHMRGANNQQAELISAVARVSIDIESVRETVATSLPNIKADLTTLQELMEDYHSRMQIIQATFEAMPTMQSEQHKLYRVLKTLNSRLSDIDQMITAVPSIQAEQAVLKDELADWNSRLRAGSLALGEFLQSEGPSERLPTFDAPPNP
jgi:chromosome segregation ATPase